MSEFGKLRLDELVLGRIGRLERIDRYARKLTFDNIVRLHRWQP
jgi:hypothetical protein